MRWAISGRLTPAAWTLIRICPGPGFGVARRTGFSASAGPLPPSMAMAVMSSGIMVLPSRLASLGRGRSDRRQSPPSNRQEGRVPMLEEPPPPRRGRGQALIEASREDLDLYSAEELNERIEQLQAEIERTRAQLVNKDAKRAAADAF